MTSKVLPKSNSRANRNGWLGGCYLKDERTHYWANKQKENNWKGFLFSLNSLAGPVVCTDSAMPVSQSNKNVNSERYTLDRLEETIE